MRETQRPPKPINESPTSPVRRAHLVHMTGVAIGRTRPIEGTEEILGRSSEATMSIEEPGVSRSHARLMRLEDGNYAIEDAGSKNGTYVNGVRVRERVVLKEGDKIRLGPTTLVKFTDLDEVDLMYQNVVEQAFRPSMMAEAPTGSFEIPMPMPWTPDSWRSREIKQSLRYEDPEEFHKVIRELKALPPLVTSWEVEELKSLIAEAQQGRRFLLQGGDCAETFADCNPEILTSKLKILIQMSLVLIKGTRRPVIRVGRFAGQYAKPRSKLTEIVDGVEMPSYMGDLVNRPGRTLAERRADPQLLLRGYFHAATTLNFVRAMSSGALADLRRQEYFDLDYFRRADLPNSLRVDYNRVSREITDGLEFMRAVGDRAFDDLMSVRFYTSHEGLNLDYESAQTRQVPRREGYYDLTTHLPWIGDRTRKIDGAHIEFFRGIENPIGLKVGPSSDPEEIVDLVRHLNPRNQPGKMILITRMGARAVKEKLPPLIDAIQLDQRPVLWVCDPMHGNGIVTDTNVKTRNFEDILEELTQTVEVHNECGTYFGGVHFELTGDDVTECIGGGISPEDLTRKYTTLCDPRLNYRQAMQMAFCLAEKLRGGGHDDRPSSIPPPPASRRSR